MKPLIGPLTVRRALLEDIATEANALLITITAYPGQHPHDPRLGERQIDGAQRLVDLVNKIAAENHCKFK